MPYKSGKSEKPRTELLFLDCGDIKVGGCRNRDKLGSYLQRKDRAVRDSFQMNNIIASCSM